MLKSKVLVAFSPSAIDEPFKRLSLFGLLLELVAFSTVKFIISAPSLPSIQKYLSWIIGSLASLLVSLPRSQFTTWNHTLLKRYLLHLKLTLCLIPFSCWVLKHLNARNSSTTLHTYLLGIFHNQRIKSRPWEYITDPTPSLSVTDASFNLSLFGVKVKS
jgi:hypothetical protein